MKDSAIHSTEQEISIEELTLSVGSLIRSIRTKRGLTRKNLANHSDVSERYLAQVEHGSANISLALLSRIASALGVRTGALLPESEVSRIQYIPLGELIDEFDLETQEKAYQLLHNAFSGERKTYSGVALIGLRGGGKTTLGQKMAEYYAVPFVRLREVIAQLAGMELGELISLTGQGIYRRLELKALRQTIEQHPHAVVETGGSLVSETETYRVLREHYYTVWVRAIPADHMNRVISQGDMRPMESSQQAMKDLKLILEERDADYRLANYQIMTSGHDVEESTSQLIKQCGRYLQDID
ncbi:MAG: helix-turn-helix transcriptional regulator [Gammaproteobacteria bacterium]|nr:helix-turn-helix transcriptional regulator [Gammaproteobacteria bacterium]